MEEIVAKGREKRPADISRRGRVPRGKRGGGDAEGGFARDGESIPGVLYPGNTSSRHTACNIGLEFYILLTFHL